MLPSIQLFSAYYQTFPVLPNAGYVTPVQAGAALVQIYSGLIYRGTELITECAASIRKM